jgi:hypothetical protein
LPLEPGWKSSQAEMSVINGMPSDEAISAMVEIARMSGPHLTPGQRSELDGLIAHGLIEKMAPDGGSEPARYAVTPKGQKLLDERGVGVNES